MPLMQALILQIKLVHGKMTLSCLQGQKTLLKQKTNKKSKSKPKFKSKSKSKYKYKSKSKFEFKQNLTKERISLQCAVLCNLFVTSKNETTNSPIHQLTNLKCCNMSLNEKARLKIFCKSDK